MKKKILIWVFIILAVIIAMAVIWYIFIRKPDPMDKPKEEVPKGSPTPSWVPEVFPLNVGMYGPQIKALQGALKITTDGKFGNQTKGAVIAAGYAVPLSKIDYDKIFSPYAKTAYANRDGVKIYKNSDGKLYKTVNKDDFVGIITGTNPDNSNYYNIDTYYRVYIPFVYLK